MMSCANSDILMFGSESRYNGEILTIQKCIEYLDSGTNSWSSIKGNQCMHGRQSGLLDIFIMLKDK